jgi:hypothetical protein
MTSLDNDQSIVCILYHWARRVFEAWFKRPVVAIREDKSFRDVGGNLNLEGIMI